MKTTNLHYNDYLSNCDLINKYNCINTNTIPRIKSIVLELPLFQFINLLNISSNSKSMIMKTYLKAYFVFYILFCIKPSINYKSIKNLSKNYSLKLKLSSMNQINNFCYTFFMHFISNFFFNFFLNFNDLNIKNTKDINLKQNITYKDLNREDDYNIDNRIKLRSSNLNFNLKVPIFCFHLLNLYTDFFFESISSKELFFHVNFIINTFGITDSNTNLLKNLPNFWMFK